MKIAGSTLVVTGGSSGLGAATVRHLVSLGANVAVLDRMPPREGTWNAEEPRIRFSTCDVTSETEVAQAIDDTSNHFGRVSGLVLCAGILHAQRVVGKEGPASLADFRRVIDVNLIGAFNVIRLGAAAMARQEPDSTGDRGVIVMTSSVAAYDGQIGQASYSASKGAIASMTLPLARDLARHAIRVVSIAPGVFETPMMQAAPENVRKSLMELTPYPPRLGDPEEFARLAQHILENQMLNGCTIRLDGALRMPAK